MDYPETMYMKHALGTIIWFMYFRRKEKAGIKLGDEFEAPAWFNIPTWIFFYLKSTSMLVAYGVYLIPFSAMEICR